MNRGSAPSISLISSACSVFHIMLITQNDSNSYGIKAVDWERFVQFSKGTFASPAVQLSSVEREIPGSSFSTKASNKQLVEMQQRLINSCSLHTNLILEVIKTPRESKAVFLSTKKMC